MLETTNYQLKKIELTDSPPDITAINPNWDAVDTKLKAAEDHIADGDIHFSAAERTKLTGIEAGANAYTHPATHAASIITQDASKRFVSDTEKATWNGKAEGEHVHDAEDISSGVLGIDRGGTGAATAAAALTALGLPYEIGTWTVTLTTVNPGYPTYAARNGRYIKIGNLVMCVGSFSLSSKGGFSSGALRIGSLPFTPASSDPKPSGTIGHHGGWTGESTYTPTLKLEGEHIYIYYPGATAPLNASAIDDDFNMSQFTITYLID